MTVAPQVSPALLSQDGHDWVLWLHDGPPPRHGAYHCPDISAQKCRNSSQEKPLLRNAQAHSALYNAYAHWEESLAGETGFP